MQNRKRSKWIFFSISTAFSLMMTFLGTKKKAAHKRQPFILKLLRDYFFSSSAFLASSSAFSFILLMARTMTKSTSAVRMNWMMF